MHEIAAKPVGTVSVDPVGATDIRLVAEWR